MAGGGLLGAWDIAPVPAAGLVVTAAAYLLSARRVGRLVPAHRWPVRRTACFVAGLLAIAVGVLGPPGALDDEFFWAHMTQHVLLTMVAAPLLVLGDPLLLALRVVPPAARRRTLVPLLRSRPVRLLTHPAAGWSLFVVVMVGSHAPRVYDYPLEHPLVHDLVEHPVYLATALLFFHPLLAPTAGPRRVAPAVRVLSVGTMMVPTAFAGFFLYVLPRVVYPFYAHVPRPSGLGPLADQQLAGALMWTSSMALGAVWLVVTGSSWLRAAARATRDEASVPTGWSA